MQRKVAGMLVGARDGREVGGGAVGGHVVRGGVGAGTAAGTAHGGGGVQQLMTGERSGGGAGRSGGWGEELQRKVGVPQFDGG